MSKYYFKYHLQRGGGDVFTPEDLNWFKRLTYRLRGYRVTKITDTYFDDYINDGKETTVTLEIDFRRQ